MKLVKEYIVDDNYYIELLNESLNEEFNIQNIKQIINKISDKSKALSGLIKKFNESRNMSARKYIASILVVMFLANFASKNSRWSNSGVTNAATQIEAPDRVERLVLQLLKQDNIDLKKIEDVVIKTPVAKEIKPELLKPKFINISSAHASDSVKNFIKKFETLNLVAYKDHGMISIGYGHAEYPKKTKLVPGKTRITKERAEQLFLQDVKEAEDGVKAIIKSWKKPQIEAKITQGMFDAMVSMAYNMGNAGLRNTDFMGYVKAGKFKTAAERIKTTKAQAVTTKKDGTKVFTSLPGLTNRRMQEYKFFASK